MTTQNRKVLAEYKLNFAEWGGKNLKVEILIFKTHMGGRHLLYESFSSHCSAPRPKLVYSLHLVFIISEGAIRIIE